jgi:hypothetical protein
VTCQSINLLEIRYSLAECDRTNATDSISAPGV